MTHFTEEQLAQIGFRARLHSARDGYCAAVDSDGCRCLRPAHPQFLPHDFSYTPYDGAENVQRKRSAK